MSQPNVELVTDAIERITEGGIVTIGWPIAALIIIGGWLLTGVYVSRANGEFDSITAEVLKEARK